MGKSEKLTTAQAVGRRVYELRKMRDISLYRIAKGTGVPYSTVKSYEHDQTGDVRAGTLISLASFFGMSLSEFTDSEYFDSINAGEISAHKNIDAGTDLKDFRELRNKSEEWALWNNSKWWYREEL